MNMNLMSSVIDGSIAVAGMMAGFLMIVSALKLSESKEIAHRGSIGVRRIMHPSRRPHKKEEAGCILAMCPGLS